MDDIPRPQSLSQIIWILVLIVIAGFFAAAETAYSNCNRIRLLSWADDGKKSAKRALSILDRFEKTIITLLIGNNVTHVIATAMATAMGIRLVGEAGGSVLATVVMTLLVFIFAETLPKNIAKVNSDSLACAFSGILKFLMIILTPISFLFLGLQNLIKKLKHSKGEGPAMTEDDFTTMIETIEDEGVLEADESELIQSAVEFPDRTVSEILTPRVRIVGLDIDAGDKACFDRIMQEKQTRLPVYQKDLDHIVGILNAKQYLLRKMQAPEKPLSIREMMTEPYFIPQDMKLHDLVNEMRKMQVHIAIVKDEWGGTEGLVTLEDLLEELVGDIWDEDELIRATGEGAKK